jgi:hypothetical protein
MDEAQLARTGQEGRNFEGVGVFKINTITLMSPCVINNKDFETQPRITGELLPNSRKMKLTFGYGQGVWTASGSCPYPYAGMGEKGEPWDISPFAPREAIFPQEGGERTFQFNLGPGKALLTIIVKLELTQ